MHFYHKQSKFCHFEDVVLEWVQKRGRRKAPESDCQWCISAGGGQKTVRHWQHLCSWAARQVPACKGSLQLVVRENLWIVNNTNYVSTRVAHLQMKGHCMVFHWVVLSQVPRLTWMVNTTSCEAKNGVLQTATTQKRQCPLVGLSATTNNQTFHNKKSWMKMDDINENQ